MKSSTEVCVRIYIYMCVCVCVCVCIYITTLQFALPEMGTPVCRLCVN